MTVLAPTLLVLAVTMAGAPAAELVLKDVGVRLEALPTKLDYTVSGPDTSVSGSDNYQLNLGTTLTGRFAFVPAGGWQGPVVGGDLFQNLGKLPGGNSQVFGLRGYGGWGLTLTREASLLALGRAGIGYGRLHLGDPGITATGRHLDMGLEGVFRWQLNPAWHAELSLGWLQVKDTYQDGDLTVDLKQFGPTVSLGMTWSVSEAPGALP
jgi:hypothetical protein